MKPIYLYDVGIKPWEQSATVGNSCFATITIVHRSVSDLFDLWLILAAAINKVLPRTLKWRTVGHSVDGSKVQELKLVKQLKADLSDDDNLEKNRDSNIYSYVKRQSVNELDLNSITQPRYTALFFLPDGKPNNSAIWEIFKNSDGGLEAKGIESSLRSCNDLLICRLYESDTHVSLQLISEVERVDLLLETLNKLGIARAESGDVAKLINS